MMTVLQVNESTGWVPEFAFEVWSFGIDCKKSHADCCCQLAQLAGDEEESKRLKAMAQKQWADNKALSAHINGMIDNMLGDFYTNGGQVLQGKLPEGVRKQIHDLLSEIKSYEAKGIGDAGDGLSSALNYARQQESFYRTMFTKLSDLYPESEVKRAFKLLAL